MSSPPSAKALASIPVHPPVLSPITVAITPSSAIATTTPSSTPTCPTKGSMFSSPVIANGIIYLGSSDGYLYTLNATKGTLLGRFAVKSPLATTPAVVNGTVYIGSANGYFYAINGQHQNWRYQVSGATFSTAIVANTSSTLVPAMATSTPSMLPKGRFSGTMQLVVPSSRPLQSPTTPSISVPATATSTPSMLPKGRSPGN